MNYLWNKHSRLMRHLKEKVCLYKELWRKFLRQTNTKFDARFELSRRAGTFSSASEQHAAASALIEFPSEKRNINKHLHDYRDFPSFFLSALQLQSLKAVNECKHLRARKYFFSAAPSSFDSCNWELFTLFKSVVLTSTNKSFSNPFWLYLTWVK